MIKNNIIFAVYNSFKMCIARAGYTRIPKIVINGHMIFFFITCILDIDENINFLWASYNAQ